MLVRLSIWLNPIIAPVLRSRLHWLLSPSLMLITVTGRKTGRRYTIPGGYHQVSDAIVVMVAEAPSKTWWRNYRTRTGRALRAWQAPARPRAGAAAGLRRISVSRRGGLPPLAPDPVDLRCRL